MARKANYPRKLENWYFKKLKELVRDWNAQASFYIQTYINPLVKGGNNLLNDDDSSLDDGNADQLGQAIDLLMSAMDNSQNEYEFNSLAKQFVYAVNQFSYRNVTFQTAIKGIDPISDNPTLKGYVKTKIDENVALIQKMNQSYKDSLRQDIYNSITKGGGTTAILQALTKRTQMTYSHAQLIANDQTGTIVSQLNFYRASHSGATKYVWHSLEDSRVRPKHQQLDGKTFDINDSNGGDNGMKPGEPIRCRCYAEFF